MLSGPVFPRHTTYYWNIMTSLRVGQSLIGMSGWSMLKLSTILVRPVTNSVSSSAFLLLSDIIISPEARGKIEHLDACSINEWSHLSNVLLICDMTHRCFHNFGNDLIFKMKETFPVVCGICSDSKIFQHDFVNYLQTMLLSLNTTSYFVVVNILVS